MPYRRVKCIGVCVCVHVNLAIRQSREPVRATRPRPLGAEPSSRHSARKRAHARARSRAYGPISIKVLRNPTPPLTQHNQPPLRSAVEWSVACVTVRNCRNRSRGACMRDWYAHAAGTPRGGGGTPVLLSIGHNMYNAHDAPHKRRRHCSRRHVIEKRHDIATTVRYTYTKKNRRTCIRARTAAAADAAGTIATSHRTVNNRQ